MPDLPSNRLAELIDSVDKGIRNPKDPTMLDVREQPVLDWWNKRKKVVDVSQGVIREKCLVLPDPTQINFQGWTGLDQLSGTEQDVTLGLEFGKYNIHSGSIFRLEELMDMGYNVIFNAKRSNPASDFTPLAQSDKRRLREYVRDRLKMANIGKDIKMAQTLLLDGTQDAKLPPGLDLMVSLDPTSGTYGGQPNTNPVMQNKAATGLTVTASGTLADAWSLIDWQANLTNGAVGMKTDTFFCGRAFLDGVKSFARANGWSVNTNASGTGKLDITIGDQGVVGVNGIKLQVVSEFDELDRIYAPAIPWGKRCYGLASKSFVLGCPFKMDWTLTAPPDSGIVRQSMYSYDWTVTPFCIKRNANYVIAIA
jgi:hypothetical protein